jgi:hypothetical protein
VVERLLEELEVPVVELRVAAVCGFRRTGVGQDEIAGERNDLLFQRIELGS